MIITINSRRVLPQYSVYPGAVSNGIRSDLYALQEDSILLSLNDIEVKFTHSPEVVTDAPRIGISLAGQGSGVAVFPVQPISMVTRSGQWDLEYIGTPDHTGSIHNFRYRFVTHILGQRLWIQEVPLRSPAFKGVFDAGFGETLMGYLNLCPLHEAFEEIRTIFLEKMCDLGESAKALLPGKLPPPRTSRFATLKDDLDF